LKEVKYGLIEETAQGAEKIDRTWMTVFWEAFSDCVFEMDAHYNVTNILRKTDSTFTMTDILGKSFLEISVDRDRALVESELEILRTTDVPYRRFTFLSKLGRYYRMTLIAWHSDAGDRHNKTFLGLRGIAVDVTEQSLREITLNWQRAIIEGSSDFISIADINGKALYINPGAYKMTGYDQASGDLLPEKIFTRAHLERVRAEGMAKAVSSGFWTSLGEMICADGSVIPVEHNIYSVRNVLDESVLIATVIRDVTDFIEHEKTIRSEQRQSELLASVAMSFSLSDDFDASMNQALASIGSYMDVDSMFIYRNNTEQKCFVFEYLWYDDSTLNIAANRKIQYMDPVTGEYTPEFTLLQSSPMFVANDLSVLEGDLFGRMRNIGVKSMVYLPIHADDKFWGLIGLNTFSAVHEWTERELRFLKTVCGILSTSLEKRLMSQRWQAAQANLQAVVRNFPGIIWSLDFGRRFTLYDGIYLSANGKNLPGIVGQNIYEYLKKYPGTIHSSMPLKVEQTFLGEPQDWMMELDNAVFRCNTVPITGLHGDIIGVVGASVDVTGMIQMQKDLEVARVAAESASVAKSEFLSRMSHEIRTPMNAIIGMTHIAQSTGDAERITSCLGKIDSASKHLLALINDILDISKIEANKLELQNEAFDLEKCIGNIYSMITVRIEEKHQNFKLNCSETLPKFLMGDELRFTQVIINLLGNAIKFTPESGMVSMEVTENSRSGDECVLEVRIRDSGIGITPEHQKKLFTPFEQGDGSITRGYGGTGLGLAISKHIVELMGGNIWMESEPGRGSMFAFTVKMRISSSAAEKKTGINPQTIQARSNDLGKFTILLAEDVEINREIVYAILENTHIKIEWAENGVNAVQMFTAAPDKYSLILMDLQMPVMDGLEATRQIRALRTKAALQIPIVAMTANVFREDVDKCIAAGMNDHIAKPIDTNQLLEKLVHYLFMNKN